MDARIPAAPIIGVSGRHQPAGCARPKPTCLQGSFFGSSPGNVLHVRIAAAERCKATARLKGNQRFQCHAYQFGLLLNPGVFTSCRNQIVFDVQCGPHMHHHTIPMHTFQCTKMMTPPWLPTPPALTTTVCDPAASNSTGTTALTCMRPKYPGAGPA